MLTYYIILSTIFIKFHIISIKINANQKGKICLININNLITIYRIIIIDSHISLSFILYL